MMHAFMYTLCLSVQCEDAALPCIVLGVCGASDNYAKKPSLCKHIKAATALFTLMSHWRQCVSSANISEQNVMQ